MLTSQVECDANPVFFLNPHGHHAFFTLIALSKDQPVHLLCPSLTLQLSKGLWRDRNLSLASLSFRESFAQAIAIVAFIAFKYHFFSETSYLKIFRGASRLFLGPSKPRTVVYYQDYLYPLLSEPNTPDFRVCELIIDTTPECANWVSTLAAVNSADLVIAPNCAMTKNWARHSSPVQLAPYGGDKRHYLSNAPTLNPAAMFLSSLKSVGNNSLIRVAARANTYRKGADLLLNALPKLDEMLSASIRHSDYRIEIQICGSLDDPSLICLAKHVQDLLAVRGRVLVTARQYPQLEYLQVLAHSDCFLMPSRLESSSLAALESLWHGIPSILSLNCGIDQFCTERHGILLQSLTSKSLAESLYSICSQPEKLLEWRSHLYQDQELFSWEGYFSAYRNLMESLKANSIG